MYVLSDKLIEHWNKHKTCLSIKQKFLQSLGLDPGEYRFTAYCAFIWEDNETPCTAIGWDEYAKLSFTATTIITLKDYIDWFAGKKKKKEKPIKEDKNVNRLQKQKTQIDRGDLPEGNRIKGRACKTSIGVGHLSYQAVKS